jgi:hypothetical protein
VVVDRHRQHLLGAILADHVLIERGIDFLRAWELADDSAERSCISSRMMSLHSSTHSSQIKTDGPGDQFAHFVLAFTAERAVQQLAVVLIIMLIVTHSIRPHACLKDNIALFPKHIQAMKIMVY